MPEFSKKDLTSYLELLGKKELEQEVKILFDKFPVVKQYYESVHGNNSTAMLEAAKAKIQKEYFPVRGMPKASNSASRKVVSDFKKISSSAKDIIDLLLYRVEVMLEFTSSYGDIDMPFYNSMASSYEEACKLIAKTGQKKEFDDRLKLLLIGTRNFGWGLHDDLVYLYEQYFKENFS